MDRSRLTDQQLTVALQSVEQLFPSCRNCFRDVVINLNFMKIKSEEGN